jgi:hypothetical protein
VAEAMDAPAPDLVHVPTELLARAAPERAGICAVNFQFNNIFDNAAACEDLGFEYTIPFIEGARRTVDWLEGHAGIADSDEDEQYERVLAAWLRAGERMLEELGRAEEGR